MLVVLMFAEVVVVATVAVYSVVGCRFVRFPLTLMSLLRATIMISTIVVVLISRLTGLVILAIRAFTGCVCRIRVVLLVRPVMEVGPLLRLMKVAVQLAHLARDFIEVQVVATLRTYEQLLIVGKTSCVKSSFSQDTRTQLVLRIQNLDAVVPTTAASQVIHD